MIKIVTTLKDIVKALEPKKIIEFEVLNPDTCSSTYSGNTLKIQDSEYVYRGYKAWIDLAQQLNCRMLTPAKNSTNTVLIQYEKLNSDESFHKSITDTEEKYGEKSIFSEIHKNEEPSFLIHYLKALENVKVNQRVRILNLGVNSGDEFEAIQEYASNFSNLELIGVDYCSSAINAAKEKFKECSNVSFNTHDINDLASLGLDRFDLIISIGTLQSSNLEFNPLFMSIVQNYLKRDGAMILGFPNCRWIDGEMIYGARVKNYPFSEMGLLYKDVIFCKKYLQQKKFRVTITGKDYIFLTATSIKKI
ncbi:MAG: methyltransferase domain-containing protein [Campylobacterota bacterium]|nr:methyltransferase domain-containing protein [Campylobacterota bacterium]